MGRAAPCLFGMYSLVALAYADLPESAQAAGGGVGWEGKCTTTFSDCLRAVRKHIWRHGILKRLDPEGLVEKPPARLREFLPGGLAPAA